MTTSINAQLTLNTDHPFQKVFLLPCQHKMERIFAEKRFGKIIDEFCELQGNRCEVCDTMVEAYTSVGKMYARQMVVERVPQYPGPPAVFELLESDLDEMQDVEGRLCRAIIFKSTSCNSVLEEFAFLGYNDLAVRIALKFKNNSLFSEYLVSQGIVCRNDGVYTSCNNEELRILFRIISAHNVIPAVYIKQLVDIVHHRLWDLYHRQKEWPMEF